MDDSIVAEAFNFGSGVLCLDFANTLDWHASDSPVEHLHDASNLVSWGQAAGVFSASTADKLRTGTGQEERGAVAAYDRAIALREAVYRIFAGQAASAEADPDDLELLNQALSDAMVHLRLVPAGDKFDYAWDGASQDLDQVYRAVAHSAAELLTSDRLDRVSQCADDRGCGYLFLDTSRNRSRRWCSMESCGNRAKAKRHYQRSAGK